MSAQSLTSILVLVSCFCSNDAESRQSPVVRGSAVHVGLSVERARLLKTTADRLARKSLGGYAALYRSKDQRGATLVTTVDGPGQIKKWFSAVGRCSVGLATSVLPGVNQGSSFVRVGQTLYYFKALRGMEEHHGSPCVPVDIRSKKGGLTEATFPATPAEMRALNAFYKARQLDLIRDGQGQAIKPQYKMLGATGTFATEGCTHTCTSAFNPLWWKAFEQNIPALRAYGTKHKIPELAAADATMVGQLKSFARRTAGVQSGRKAVIRANFAKAPLITIFNSGMGHNPLRDLSWRGGRWNGLTQPRVIHDRAPHEKSAAFLGERVSLRDFSRQLAKVGDGKQP